MYILPPVDPNMDSIIARGLRLDAQEKAARAAAAEVNPSSPGMWANGHQAGFNPYIFGFADSGATTGNTRSTLPVPLAPTFPVYTGPTTPPGDPNFGTLEQTAGGGPLSLTTTLMQILAGSPPPSLASQYTPPPGATANPLPPPSYFGGGSELTPIVRIDPPVYGGSGQSSTSDPITGAVGSTYVLPPAPSFTVSAIQSVADTAGAAPAGSGAVDTGLLGALLGAIGGGSSVGSSSDPGSGVATSSPIAMPSPQVLPASPAQNTVKSSTLSPVLVIGLVVIGLVAFWYFALRKRTNPHAIGPAA